MAPTPKIRITSIQKLTPSPLEVYLGYDVKVLLTLECGDPLPGWWGKLSSYTPIERGTLTGTGAAVEGSVLLMPNQFPDDPVAATGSADGVGKPPVKGTAYYLVKLRGLRGPVRLQDQMPFYWDQSPIPKAVVPVDVRLLALGETGQIPAVSKAPGAKINSVTVEPDGPPNSGRVLVRVTHTPLVGNFESGTYGAWVYDGANKDVGIKPKYDDSLSGPKTDGTAETVFTLDLGGVPRSVGKLEARGYIAYGSQWPAQFTIPLRGADGKLLFKRAAAPAREH